MARARITRYSKLDVEAELPQPRLIALLFADHAAETKEGKIVLTGIFDTLHLQPAPPYLAAFFMYVRLAETYRDPIKIVAYRPDGTPIGEMSIDPSEVKPVEGEPIYVQGLSQIAMEFPVVGTWWFEVLYQDRTLGRVPFLVKLREAPSAS